MLANKWFLKEATKLKRNIILVPQKTSIKLNIYIQKIKLATRNLAFRGLSLSRDADNTHKDIKTKVYYLFFSISEKKTLTNFQK